MTKDDKGKSPKAKKTKTKAKEAKEVEVEAVPYEVRMKAVTVISKPMADEKKVCVCVGGVQMFFVSLVCGLHLLHQTCIILRSTSLTTIDLCLCCAMGAILLFVCLRALSRSRRMPSATDGRKSC